MSLSNSCVSENVPMYLFFVDESSKTIYNGNNSISSTTSSFFCNGIYKESTGSCIDNPFACSGTCANLEAKPCQLTSTIPICFSDWGDISESIILSGETGLGGIFTICPDTVFDLSIKGQDESPFVISSSNTIIQCGEDGAKKNNCIIHGGDEQLKIVGPVSNILISGLVFIKSKKISFAVLGEVEKVAFHDCDWVVRIKVL